MRFGFVCWMSLAACVGKPIDEIGIACTDDTECPRGAWCDLRYADNQCYSLEGSGPPHVAFDGFVIGEQLVPTITVPRSTVSIHSVRLRNDGGSQTDVEADFTGPACLDISALGRGELVDIGKTSDADFTVRPAVGCPSPATITITAEASKRVFTYTAMISIAP